MNFKTILLLPCLLVSLWGSSQGLIFDDERYGQQPRQSQYNDGSKSEESALKGIPRYSLKSYCPRVQNQGKTASCVGWASGYAALSIQKAIANNWKGQIDQITDEAFSSMFIFNQIKITHCENGAFIDSAMVLLKNTGDVFSKTYDHDKVDCERYPSPTDLEQANSHKIMDFKTLFEPNDPYRIKINKTKLSLTQHRPVIIGMRIPESFQKIKSGKDVWFPMPNERATMGHAMTVIGFDDAKEAFEIMNSWSTRWGNEGFIWVKYVDFSKYCAYAFQMSLKEKLEKEKRYTASFHFHRFVGLTAGGEPLFSKSEQIKLKDGIYELTKEDLKRGDIFQLLVSQVTANTYLYVFSVDPDHQINVHWPRSLESAEITTPDVTLYIPKETGGLQFNQSGTEYIGMLYSNQPITDFADKVLIMNELKSGLSEKLSTAFGSRLMPSKDIRFEKRKMKFRNEIKAGAILPLILKINVK